MKTLETEIAEHPFLASMRTDHIAVLAECARTEEFTAQQVLFHEGEPANKFYLIQEGRVSLETHAPGQGNIQLQVLGPGEVLGWSWLFPPFWWHFQARALEPVRALVCDGGHLLSTCERDPRFGYELMKRIAQVLIKRLQATRQKLLEAPHVSHCDPVEASA